ncbi:iron complex transport system ATP-binding protein [Enterococcus sp. AZ194]|uniref:ABC transporter ATP-binding protein n=1 Tax=Enterococcus sp. AZ194 TaxID=2774629 RepID=UPI003F1F9F5C
MIRLEKTSVTIQQNKILKNLSLQIETGAHVCILGPNGCGKTTLLKTIAGVLSYEGSVSIDGKEVARTKRKQLASKVAMMSQFTNVAFDYTVFEVVMMGCYHQQKGLFPQNLAEEKKRVLDCLEQMDLLELKDRIVNRLSGGQQQRVFLARLFVQNPEIILLDEPNNHLDIRYQRELIQNLKEWGKQEGKTIIGVFHDIRLAITLSQKVIFVKDGEIVQQGDFLEIATRENLQEIFELDIVTYFQKQHEVWQKIQ